MRYSILSLALVFLLISAIFVFMPTMKAYADIAKGGFWRFDEGIGTVVHDSSGNQNAGSIHGGAVWTNGKSGRALDFDGSGDYVEVPDSDSLDVTVKITLEAWVYPRSLTDRQVIICKYNHTILSSSYYLGLGGTLGSVTYMNKIYFALCIDGNQYYAMVSTTNITANTWTHVAATMNGTHMILYVNGVKDKVRTFPPSVIYAGNASLRIGCYLPEFGYPRFFNGAIDEARVSAGVIWTVDDDGMQCPNADFTNIQSAVNTASSGDTIIVHEGYYPENVNLNKALMLRSASRPIIDGTQTGACITIAANNVVVDGFELKNGTYGIASWGTDESTVSNNIIHDILNVPGYAGCGIMFWSDSDDFDNNTIIYNQIYDCDRQGVYIGGESPGYVSEGNRIAENTIHNNGLYTFANGPDASVYGIQLSFADSNLIERNEIYGHDDWFPYPDFDFAQGIYLYDSNNNLIRNNYLHDNNYGVGIWRPGRGSGNNYVNYNNIEKNTGYGIMTFDGPPTVDARFNWWGNATGPTHSSNSGGTGDAIGDNVDYSPWLGNPYEIVPRIFHVNPTGTIQEAIDEAGEWDTVLVHYGTYSEALYINKNLIINAVSTPIIRGGQMRVTNYGNRQATIFVEDANNVVLQNLDVEGQGLGGAKSYAIIYENSGGTVQGCTISPNRVGDMSNVAIAAWDNTDLTIKDSVIRNFGRIGVYSNNATLSIEGNSIIGQVYDQDNLVNYGIEIEDYSGPSVADIKQNFIYNCNNTNPNPLWSSAAIIVDTWREWNDYYNLPLLPSKVSITYNEIYNNYESIEIVANEFSYAHSNNFYNNTWGVWSAPENWTTNPTYYVFDARYNWWGNVTGPRHSTTWMYMGNPYGPHLGGGDIVSDYVLYYLWLGAPSGPAVEPPTASFTYSPSSPKKEETATFNASSSTPNGGTIVLYEWNFGDGNTTTTTSSIITHIYNEVGTYNVTLTVTDSESLTDSTWQEVTVVPAIVHDVAVTDVTVPLDAVYQGWNITISVTVANLGNATENFTVSLYYDSFLIGTQPVQNLEPNTTSTLHFVWNTLLVPYCHNYTIEAVASTVLGETNTADNTYVDGTIKVRIMGDVDGDGDVDMRDIGAVAVAFGATLGQERWNIYVDLDQNGRVDMRDIGLVCANFGKKCL